MVLPTLASSLLRALVQRVEYIRGPRSAVYGSDAIGGVVNIITTRDEPGTEISAGWGSNSYQNYDVSTQQQLGDKTRVTLLGDYAHTHGYDVVAYGNTGTQAQTDNDVFLSKTLYGALEHNFTDAWSGFVRGYGYDNRTNYDAYYSPGSPLLDIRKLYSQSWDAGLRYNGELIKSQLITSYSHSKDYNYDPHYGRHGTWQTSAGWEFIEGYRFIASYGTSYKAPNLGQLYGFYGNPNLDPEKSKQWEGAFEGLTAGVNWRISGYRNDVSDLIDYDDHTLKYYNEGKARIKGVEATANFDTGPLTHTVSYDYVDARNAITDTPLLRRAKQQVKYQLDWQLYDFDWGITYQYLGTRYDKDYSSYPYQTVKMGGVSLWDLAVAYPVTSHLTVRGKIANLFDKDYETVYGYQTAGREYTLSGSYTF